MGQRAQRGYRSPCAARRVAVAAWLLPCASCLSPCAARRVAVAVCILPRASCRVRPVSGRLRMGARRGGTRNYRPQRVKERRSCESEYLHLASAAPLAALTTAVSPLLFQMYREWSQ